MWGGENEGRINNDDSKYFYFKDHLGSIRAIVDENYDLVSAQDYDPWGYLLSGRSFDSDESEYKFTGKERDEESDYDYFGARYYDSRIARWLEVDPSFNKYLQFSPYIYTLNNPIILVDPNGKDPYRKYLGSAKQVLNIIEQNAGKSYAELSNVFSESNVRYIYTEKGGFIDLRLFFAAASLADKFTVNEILMGGEALEFGQGARDKESSNDPEDRPSNWEGAKFGKKNQEEVNIYENFEYYLDEQVTLDPTNTQISSDKIYIPYDENDTPLPERISYSPYRGEFLKKDNFNGLGKY